jgi:hypothetical protein
MLDDEKLVFRVNTTVAVAGHPFLVHIGVPVLILLIHFFKPSRINLEKSYETFKDETVLSNLPMYFKYSNRARGGISSISGINVLNLKIFTEQMVTKMQFWFE